MTENARQKLPRQTPVRLSFLPPTTIVNMPSEETKVRKSLSENVYMQDMLIRMCWEL